MFNGKLTANEKREKLLILQANKQNLEANRQTRELIAAWKDWQKLSYAEQQKRRSEWFAYYEEVKESPIYHLFLEQKKASQKKDIGRVRELAGEAKKMQEVDAHRTITKPIYADPFEFDFNPIIKSFRKYDEQIKALYAVSSIDEEQKQVWGT